MPSTPPTAAIPIATDSGKTETNGPFQLSGSFKPNNLGGRKSALVALVALLATLQLEMNAEERSINLTFELFQFAYHQAPVYFPPYYLDQVDSMK